MTAGWMFRAIAKTLRMVVVVALLAPWVVFGIVRWCFEEWRRWFAAWKAEAALSQTLAVCQRGHVSELEGVFQCACGAHFAGHAFGACPVCRRSAGYTTCEHCGLAIPNPALIVMERVLGA